MNRTLKVIAISIALLLGLFVFSLIVPSFLMPDLAVGVDYDVNPTSRDRIHNEKLTALLVERYPVGSSVEKLEQDLKKDGWGPSQIDPINKSDHPWHYVQYERTVFKPPFPGPLQEVTTIMWKVNRENNSVLKISGGFYRDCRWCP